MGRKSHENAAMFSNAPFGTAGTLLGLVGYRIGRQGMEQGERPDIFTPFQIGSTFGLVELAVLMADNFRL